MEKQTSILVVDDIARLRALFRQGLDASMPNLHIVDAANLKEAREKLAEHDFDAIITDCGFPDIDEKVRESHNRNGPLLIGEIRKGQYGPVNAAAPIAFNSAELTDNKKHLALSHGGNTTCYRKGSLYGALTRGTARDNFTVGSVAGETVKWLESELTPEKISERRAQATQMAEEDQPQKGGWSVSRFLGFTRDKRTSDITR